MRSVPPIELTGDDKEAEELLKKAVSASLLNGKSPQAVLDQAAQQLAAATKRGLAQ